MMANRTASDKEIPASLQDFMAAAASAISAGESSNAESPALLFSSSTWPGFARSFCPCPKIHALASARFEKSFLTTGPPVNRLPRRIRQNYRPRPLAVLVTPTPDGKSLIRALKRVRFIRQLSAQVNNRVKCQTVNPLAYAFSGSNPLLPMFFAKRKVMTCLVDENSAVANSTTRAEALLRAEPRCRARL